MGGLRRGSRLWRAPIWTLGGRRLSWQLVCPVPPMALRQTRSARRSNGASTRGTGILSDGPGKVRFREERPPDRYGNQHLSCIRDPFVGLDVPADSRIRGGPWRASPRELATELVHSVTRRSGEPGTDLDPDRAIVERLESTPAKSVSSWSKLATRALEVDWARVSALAIQHRVEGILIEAAELAGFDDQIPPSLLSTLRRRADLAEARQWALSESFRRLAEVELLPVSDLIVYKGMHLVGMYEKPRHRMVSDLDLMVPPEALPAIADGFASAGYRERITPSGPAFIGPSPTPQIGCEFVSFDLHVDPFPRFRRLPTYPMMDWYESSSRFELAGIPCRTLGADLELLVALVYLGEHAVSWIHACLDDDVRLIKVLDVELLCASAQVDVSAFWRLVENLKLEGSVALGLAVVMAIRRGLPPTLLPLLWTAEAVGDLLDSVALPDGKIGRWSRPFTARVFETDRSMQALKLMAAGRQHRREWHDAEAGPDTGAEDVMAVTNAAAERLSGRLPV
jgi:Uncharacterised nucleotidyltransferase